jgi:hypothetical protein
VIQDDSLLDKENPSANGPAVLLKYANNIPIDYRCEDRKELTSQKATISEVRFGKKQKTKNKNNKKQMHTIILLSDEKIALTVLEL